MHRWLAALALLAATAGTALAASEQKPLPDADEVTQNLDHVEGFYKLYFKRQQPHRREPPVKLYAEIPLQEIGQPFLMATSITGGTTYAGWQWSEQLLTWERHGEDKLVLIERDVRYRAEGGGPLAEVVRRTYSDRFVKAVAILGEGHHGENRGFLVDAKELFGDNAALFFGVMGGMLDPSVARFEEFKSFPNNTEIAVTMPARGSGQLTTLHYSISRLPRTDYRPRVADDRIGYFLTAVKDFSHGRPEDDCFVRFINRWDLQKADASLKLSPPKRSIVFYVEKTVPIRFRRYVREGILEWNKAFEKIGFTEAIVVRQQTDDNEFKDYDPEDLRYNFFRWITSETPFAMGPSRVNPMTGEIINLTIIFDDSMVRHYLRDYEEMIKKSPETFFSPHEQRFFQQMPEASPLYGLKLMPPSVAALGPVAGPADATIADTLPQPAALRAACSYGEGLAHEVSLGIFAELARGGGSSGTPNGEYPEEFIGQVVKEVVMHEVGHTLGLRHNFKASTWLSLKEINAAKEGTATVGSVMDYNPVNIAPPGTAQGSYITSTIGPYDYWAIEYGYKDVGKDEELRAIASRVAEKGLAYATDEDTWSPDPLVNRFDLGSDPLEFAKARLDLVKKLMPAVVKRVVPDGEGYQRSRRALDMLLYEYLRSAAVAAKFVGGTYAHRDHKGDPNERPPLVPVEPARQREALKMVCDSVFAEGGIQVPQDVLKYLAAGRWSHWGVSDWAEEVNYPLHERILAIQGTALSLCLSPDRLQLVHDDEAGMADTEDALTLPEILDTLTRSIFAEVQPAKGADSGVAAVTPAPTVRKPLISSIRASLQRAYLGRLVGIAIHTQYGNAPQVTRALAYQQLKGILANIEQVRGAGGNLDAYTSAHLDELATRIKRALEAQIQGQ